MSTIGITTFYFKKEGPSALSCMERLDGLYYLGGPRYVIDAGTFTELSPHERDDTTRRIILIALSCLTGIGLIVYAFVHIRRYYYHYQLNNTLRPRPQQTAQLANEHPVSQSIAVIPTTQRSVRNNSPAPPLPLPPATPSLQQTPQVMPQPLQEVVPTTENTNAVAIKQMQNETEEMEQRIHFNRSVSIATIEAQSKQEALKQEQAHKAQVQKDKEERETRALNFEGSAPYIKSKAVSSIERLSFLQNFTQYDKTKHTFKFRGKEFTLLTTFTTHFNQPVAFIGELTQPICFIDPEDSPQLIALAERLKNELAEKGAGDDLAKLEYIKDFVVTKAFPKPPIVAPIPKPIGAVAGVDHCIFYSKQKPAELTLVPLISMEDYLKYPGNENSLHKALLLAFLLSFLVKNKVLSEGTALIMFDNVQNFRGKYTHFWNQFLVPSKNERWHLDTHSFIHEQAPFVVPVCDLNVHSTQMLLKDRYSPKSIDAQMQTADSVLEYLQNSGGLSLPAYVELCSRAGGVFISKTSSGIEGSTAGARYHALWQLLLNCNLKFAFYKSSAGGDKYSCLTYVHNRVLLGTFGCPDPTSWSSAFDEVYRVRELIDEVCSVKELAKRTSLSGDWKELKDAALTLLSYRYINGRPEKAKALWL